MVIIKAPILYRPYTAEIPQNMCCKPTDILEYAGQARPVMNLDVSWTRRSAEFKDNLAKPINQRMDPVTRTPTSYVRYRLETPSRNVSEAEKAHHTECLI